MRFVTCDTWNDLLSQWADTPTGSKVRQTVKEERTKHTIYPQPSDLFRAFNLTPFDKVKVVILGQDPYHNGVADGLAFSVNGPQPSPSLRVIFNELMRTEFVRWSSQDEVFKTYQLDRWAKQGVLLINTVLTVRKGEANSHKGIGWEDLIDRVIEKLNEKQDPVVFMLWGKQAQGYKSKISDRHLVLEAVHPQAENYGGGHKFTGCDHFIKANKFIKETFKHTKLPIAWDLVTTEV